MFTVAITTDQELPLMAYWAIEQEDPKYVFRCPVEVPSEEIMKARIDNMKKRLKVLTKGLLDVDEPRRTYEPIAEIYLFEYTVTFAHRTVKDYLRLPEAQSMLASWSGDTFSPDWEICKALGTLAKMAPEGLFHAWGPIRRLHKIGFRCHAPRLAEHPMYRMEIPLLLDHMQTTLAPTFKKVRDGLQKSFEEHDRYGRAIKGKEGLQHDLLILTACIACGHPGYVADKLASEPQLLQRVTDSLNPLVCCVERIISDRGEEDQEIRDSGKHMLELFLAHGADLQCVFNDLTEWQLVMEDLGQMIHPTRFVNDIMYFDVIKLLLRHGADMEQNLKLRGNAEEIKARELLKKWYAGDRYGMLEDVVARRTTKTKTSQKLLKKMRHLKLWMNSKR